MNCLPYTQLSKTYNTLKLKSRYNASSGLILSYFIGSRGVVQPLHSVSREPASVVHRGRGVVRTVRALDRLAGREGSSWHA